MLQKLKIGLEQGLIDGSGTRVRVWKGLAIFGLSHKRWRLGIKKPEMVCGMPKEKLNMEVGILPHA